MMQYHVKTGKRECGGVVVGQTVNQCSVNAANRLGLDYRIEASMLPFSGTIYDIHTHLNTVESAGFYMEVARLYGVSRVWSMTPLECIDQFRAVFGDQVEFIAAPHHVAMDDEQTFTRELLDRIEAFAAKGAKICKFWAAPRSLDRSPLMALDSKPRWEAMRLARSLGMIFMCHVGDPDTWFATHYRDRNQYGNKESHFSKLRRALDEFGDVPWIVAHMGGWPERLDIIQDLFDQYPRYYVDCSATKWMVRELSRHGDAFADFCRRNRGRILFGTDLVVNDENMDFDHYASRFWSLRTLLETDYDGPSPIVDPDLAMMDPSLSEDSTARLHGMNMQPAILELLYAGAAAKLLEPLYQDVGRLV